MSTELESLLFIEMSKQLWNRSRDRMYCLKIKKTCQKIPQSVENCQKNN